LLLKQLLGRVVVITNDDIADWGCGRRGGAAKYSRLETLCGVSIIYLSIGIGGMLIGYEGTVLVMSLPRRDGEEVAVY
jgi:hypothetical protein